MKAPLRVEQAMLAALEHSITHATITWHDIGTNITVRNAIERLAKRPLWHVDAV